MPELKTDPRFQERDTRKAKRKELTPLLEAKLILQSTLHWVDVLNEKGIPSGDIYGLEKALLQPQSEHRRVSAMVKEAGIGDIKLFNLTAKFSKTPASIDAPPPRLGAIPARS